MNDTSHPALSAGGGFVQCCCALDQLVFGVQALACLACAFVSKLKLELQTKTNKALANDKERTFGMETQQ
jgi:hypothetical protein